MSDWPVERDPVYGCRLWTGRLDEDGYPRTTDGKLAYRVVFEAERGPIPPGKELDHECRRRRCVCHLEPVTRSENEKRKSWAYRVKIKTCSRGHALTVYTAIVTPEGGRICRTCRNEQTAR